MKAGGSLKRLLPFLLTVGICCGLTIDAGAQPGVEVPPFRVAVQEGSIQAEQGQPALLRIGMPYPVLTVADFQEDGLLQAAVFRDGEVVAQAAPQRVNKGASTTLSFAGTAQARGNYEIRLSFERAKASRVYHTLYFTAVADDAEQKAAMQAVYLDEQGQLQYAPDYLGNRVPDFSYAGYGGGGIALPDVPVKSVVEPGEGDDAARIQAALNAVANLPVDAQGFRGAVLLKRGTYQVAGSITINTSGVVLRGEGDGEDGTVIVASGTAERDLILVHGEKGVEEQAQTARRITDLYVPVGARYFHVEHPTGLRVGDTIVVRRYGNAAWIHAIGMDQLPSRDDRDIVQWQPFALNMERVVTDIADDQITVDAPIVNAIEWEWGGGEIVQVIDQRIEHVGIERLRGVSEYNAKVRCMVVLLCDEKHAQNMINLDNVKNSWVSGVTARHFFHGVAFAGEGSKWLTIQDSSSLDPVSTLTGSRRYPFHVMGQLILLQRLYSDEARHAFVFNRRVTGPNVFLHSLAEGDYTFSEPHLHWAVGGLYDNVRAPIAIQDRYTYGSGHGWSGANFVAWNTTGKLIVQKPPTAQNWAIGHVGTKMPGDFTPRAEGYWVSYGKHVEPQSLYLQQLQNRLGAVAVTNIGYPLGVNSVVNTKPGK